jgi:hypothetical protein
MPEFEKLAEEIEELNDVIESVKGDRGILRVSGTRGDPQDVGVLGIARFSDLARRLSTALRSVAPSAGSPASAVTVKPLDWSEILVDRGDGMKEVDGWEADSGFSLFYTIEVKADCFRVDFDHQNLGEFETEREAKSCAQNDYACRICDAFAAPPVHTTADGSEPDILGYAQRLAVSLKEKFPADHAPDWKPLGDILGVLTQIDNITTGLVARTTATTTQDSVREALRNVRAAIMEADPAVLCCTLWMPNRISPAETVVDHIDAALSAAPVPVWHELEEWRAARQVIFDTRTTIEATPELFRRLSDAETALMVVARSRNERGSEAS